MNEQSEERLSTSDLAASAGQRRDELTNQSIQQGGSFDAPGSSGRTPLFPTDQSDGFRGRWMSIQSGFVDEPRHAVEQADSLIAEVMKTLATSFSEERQHLEEQWDRGDDVSTEDLRLGLQRYRSFFDRLLSI